MAIPHAASGELIDIGPMNSMGGAFDEKASTTLVRAKNLEVFRLVLPAGKVLQEHKAAGAITIQCLEGVIELRAHGRNQRMQSGQLVYLADAEPHAVTALENSSLLITIQLHRA